MYGPAKPDAETNADSHPHHRIRPTDRWPATGRARWEGAFGLGAAVRRGARRFFFVFFVFRAETNGCSPGAGSRRGRPWRGRQGIFAKPGPASSTGNFCGGFTLTKRRSSVRSGRMAGSLPGIPAPFPCPARRGMEVSSPSRQGHSARALHDGRPGSSTVLAATSGALRRGFRRALATRHPLLARRVAKLLMRASRASLTEGRIFRHAHMVGECALILLGGAGRSPSHFVGGSQG